MPGLSREFQRALDAGSPEFSRTIGRENPSSFFRPSGRTVTGKGFLRYRWLQGSKIQDKDHELSFSFLAFFDELFDIRIPSSVWSHPGRRSVKRGRGSNQDQAHPRANVTRDTTSLRVSTQGVYYHCHRLTGHDSYRCTLVCSNARACY